MELILGGLNALKVFVASLIPIMGMLVIGLVCYLEKKQEHRQILAAIEKGVPVSELKLKKAEAKKNNKTAGPGWVKDITEGITFLVIALGIGFVFYNLIHMGPMPFALLWIVPIVFFGVGIGRLIRGCMRRKYEKQPTEQSDENTSGTPSLPEQ